MRRCPVSMILLAGWTAAGAAQIADVSPIARGRIAFTLSDRELIPESIAHDPADGAFYVGSMYKRKIVRIAPTGAVADFVPQAADGIWSVLGIKVDATRRELLANACNLEDRSPPMVPDDSDTRGLGGLFRYDLRTGRLIAKYTVGWARAARCFNDLAIVPDGTIYLSAGRSQPAGVRLADHRRARRR